MADGVKFAEAIAFLRERLDLSPQAWLDLVREVDAAARDRAAGMTDAMVQDILAEILKAIEDGGTLQAFQEAFAEIAHRHGWEDGSGGPAGWRAALTFRVMTAQAMAAGRWRQIQQVKARRPYLRYITAGDHRVRDAHKAWHNLVLHADDPWWRTHFPPNGWNCRCHVQALDEHDLKRYKLSVGEAPPDNPVIKFVVGPDGVKKPVEVPAGIDPGFAFNVGEIGLQLPNV